MSDKRLRVLVLEPYWGGSHKSVLEGLMDGLPFQWTLMQMPARKWKWRMRLAATHFAHELNKSKQQYDRVLCSTFVDVAALRALGPRWLMDIPVLTYFHENQFAYPVSVYDKQDINFGVTNMTTAMASDALAFNSRYNMETFLSGISGMLKRLNDMDLDDPTDAIRQKSTILSPGLDYGLIDDAVAPASHERPVVLWNHRWEHDKNPEEFFNALFELDRQGLDFGLIVLGQSFARRPEIFDEAQNRLAHRIIHFGYAESREEYARLLGLATLEVSTAIHEFFGLAVLEAVRAGCRPLLPRRLAYPELFPAEYLYDDGGLVEALSGLINGNASLDPGEVRRLTEPHSWQSLLPLYSDWIATSSR